MPFKITEEEVIRKKRAGTTKYKVTGKDEKTGATVQIKSDFPNEFKDGDEFKIVRVASQGTLGDKKK